MEPFSLISKKSPQPLILQGAAGVILFKLNTTRQAFLHIIAYISHFTPLTTLKYTGVILSWCHLGVTISWNLGNHFFHYTSPAFYTQGIYVQPSIAFLNIYCSKSRSIHCRWHTTISRRLLPCNSRNNGQKTLGQEFLGWTYLNRSLSVYVSQKR